MLLLNSIQCLWISQTVSKAYCVTPWFVLSTNSCEMWPNASWKENKSNFRTTPALQHTTCITFVGTSELYFHRVVLHHCLADNNNNQQLLLAPTLFHPCTEAIVSTRIYYYLYSMHITNIQSIHWVRGIAHNHNKCIPISRVISMPYVLRDI